MLRQALQHFGRTGGAGLERFTALLDDLPDEASGLPDARKIAAEIANTLAAVKVNDRTFAGDGEPVDPGVLLTPPPGKRARVSVISYVGIADEPARQSFVNQLQMALFAWIRRNPAPDGTLGGLLVMDEAQTIAPSGGSSASTPSSVALAQQARKYGLGLVFATQAIKGLDNRIAGNAATQIVGRMSAPVQIKAARDLAQAKGGDIPDVSRLGKGQFYVAVEGGRFHKTRTPLCLTYHPQGPLRSDEVVDRAREGS